jgi:hypothetical protein
MDGNELENAFTKARDRLFHDDAVDGKIGVEVMLI